MLRVIEKEPDVLFTDGDLWPPQTFMLNAIRDWITDCPFDPHTALGIDRNPTLIEILTSKWPWIEITEASYPEHDAQA